MTTLVVRHSVTDYNTWRKVFDEHAAIRRGHGATAERLLRDGNDVLALIDFPDSAAAQAFQADPSLKQAMQSAGVIGAPDIHTWHDFEESH